MKKLYILVFVFFAIAMNAMADNISIADVTLTRGTAKSVDVSLTNTATNIVGFQFDLTLPAGVTLATSSTGAVTNTATSRLGSNYTLRGKLQSGTTYRFVYLSTSGIAISGTSGSLFSISLTADAVVACGSNVATISGVTITGKDGTETTPSDATFNITIPHSLTATVAKAATCTEVGNIAYWYCSLCTKYFSDSSATAETNLEAMTIAALGHNYGEPVWTWADDGKTASAKITCTNDASHVLFDDAIVTSTIKTAATCTAKGVTTYTAKVTLNEIDYTDTKDVEDIEALGHDFLYEDNGDGTHKVTCSRCDYTANEAHTFVDGACDKCDATEDTADDPANYTTALYGGDSEGCANGTFALPIELKSDFDVKAFEFDVTLPDGMSFVTDGSGYACTRTSRVSSGYTITCKTVSGQSSNIAHVLCSNTSNPNDVISGTSGTVLYISVAIASTVNKGNYNVSVSGITLVKADGSEYSDLYNKKFNAKVSVIDYILGDANNSGKVNVADITAVVSYIYGTTPEVFNKTAADINGNGLINVADITGIVSIIYGGNSNAKSMNVQNKQKSSISIPSVNASTGDEIHLPIFISNSGNVSSFQFDLSLPENIHATDVMVMSDSHTVIGSFVEDGLYRIMCYSNTNATIMDTESPVAYVTLKIDNTIEPGIYDMAISLAVTSLSGEEETPVTNCGKINIEDATGISNLSDDNSYLDEVTTIGGIHINKSFMGKLPRGIYIVNGKKQVIK